MFPIVLPRGTSDGCSNRALLFLLSIPWSSFIDYLIPPRSAPTKAWPNTVNKISYDPALGSALLARYQRTTQLSVLLSSLSIFLPRSCTSSLQTVMKSAESAAFNKFCVPVVIVFNLLLKGFFPNINLFFLITTIVPYTAGSLSIIFFLGFGPSHHQTPTSSGADNTMCTTVACSPILFFTTEKAVGCGDAP